MTLNHSLPSHPLTPCPLRETYECEGSSQKRPYQRHWNRLAFFTLVSCGFYSHYPTRQPELLPIHRTRLIDSNRCLERTDVSVASVNPPFFVRPFAPGLVIPTGDYGVFSTNLIFFNARSLVRVLGISLLAPSQRSRPHSQCGRSPSEAQLMIRRELRRSGCPGG